MIPTVSVVIPCYNEVGTLRELHTRLRAEFERLELQAEILFVDDGSTDGSREALRALAAEDPLCRVVIFRCNGGKAAALQAGFALAQGEYILTLDADLQDDPAEAPRFLEALQQADVVSGRRTPANGAVAPEFFNRMVRAVTGVKLHDISSGWKGYRHQVLREVTIYGELHRFLPALAAARGFRVVELPVKHFPRRSGKSKYEAENFPHGLLDLFTVAYLTKYRFHPLRYFGGLGSGFLLVGLALGAVLSPYLTITTIEPPQWHFFMWLLALALVILGPLFIALGVVAEAQLASTLPSLPPPPVMERINCEENVEV
ncbi:MAG: glycosyltransferase family 2 protein [Armatimonadota bacterium]